MHVLRARASRGEVVVFQPRWCDLGEGPTRFPQRTVPFLGALREAGYDVRFLEEAHDGPPTAAWRPWLEAAIAGVAWCGEMYPALQIPGVRAFLALCASPSRRPAVVGGGFFPLLDPGGLGLDDRTTAVVLGPGEVVLPELIETLRVGGPLGGVAGIGHFTPAGCVRTPPARRRPLAAAFHSPLAELDLRRYLTAEPRTFGNDAPALQIHTGSGCAKRCPFCFDEHTPYGVFDADAVVDAIATVLRRTGIAQILFGELDFFHRTARAVAVAEGILARGLRLRWFALGSICDVQRLTDAELRVIAASGCHRVEIGVESGSDAMLARLGKRHRRADALEAVARLRRHGIHTTSNLLFGVPGESEDDRWATVDLAFELQARDPQAHFNVRLYQIIPTTTTGAAAAAWTQWLPRTLDDLERYRQELVGPAGRALPWFRVDEERWIRTLVDYLLPMALGEITTDRGPLARGLQAAARMRCRHRLRRVLGFDRRLAEHVAGTALVKTYVT